jgi:hypothetical protein
LGVLCERKCQSQEKLAKYIAEGINNGTILSWLKDFDEK